jgi:hypothetical protein
MKFKYSALAIVCLLFGFGAAQGQPCGCADKQDLLKLLNMSQMAIQEFTAQLEHLKDRESAAGNSEPFTRQANEKLWESVNAALDNVRGRGTGKYELPEMNTRDCSFRETGTPNECRRQIYKSLFDVYLKACRETKDLPLERNPYGKMKQVILHEISAFQAMQNLLLKLLDALPKNCRPNDWFGYVVFQSVKTSTVSRTILPTTNIPRPAAGISVGNGGNEITGTNSTYIGTIFVEEGEAATARAYAANSLKVGKTVSGRIYCSPKKPDVEVVDTNGRNDFADGESEGRGGFRLDIYPQKGKYHIYVTFFAVRISGQMHTFGSSAGGCRNQPFEYKTPVNMRVGGMNHGIDGRLTPNAPDYIEGSRTERPPELQLSRQENNSSGNFTYETTTRWMLRRLGPKK